LQCAESALKSVIGDLSNTYFVGNAPMAHMVVQPKEEQAGSTSFKVLQFTIGKLTSFILLFIFIPACVAIFWRCLVVQHNSLCLLILSFAKIFCQKFFFKSQVIAKNKFDIGKCEEFVWVTKDELMEYFPEQADFFNKMIIS
jgi:large subunit ribosomal protein L46